MHDYITSVPDRLHYTCVELVVHYTEFFTEFTRSFFSPPYKREKVVWLHETRCNINVHCTICNSFNIFFFVVQLSPAVYKMMLLNFIVSLRSHSFQILIALILQKALTLKIIIPLSLIPYQKRKLFQTQQQLIYQTMPTLPYMLRMMMYTLLVAAKMIQMTLTMTEKVSCTI